MVVVELPVLPLQAANCAAHAASLGSPDDRQASYCDWDVPVDVGAGIEVAERLAKQEAD